MQSSNESIKLYSTRPTRRRIAHSSATEAHSISQGNATNFNQRDHSIAYQKSADHGQFNHHSRLNKGEDLSSGRNEQRSFVPQQTLHRNVPSASQPAAMGTSNESRVTMGSLGTLQIPKSYGLFARPGGLTAPGRLKKSPFAKNPLRKGPTTTENSNLQNGGPAPAKRSQDMNPFDASEPSVINLTKVVDDNDKKECAFVPNPRASSLPVQSHLQSRIDLKEKFVRAFAAMDDSNEGRIKHVSQNGDVRAHSSAGSGSLASSIFRPPPTPTSSSSLTFYKADTGKNDMDTEGGDCEMPLNLSRPPSVMSVANEPLDFRSPPPPSAPAKVYEHQQRSSSRCSVASNHSQISQRNTTGGTINLRSPTGNGDVPAETRANLANPSSQNGLIKNKKLASRFKSHQEKMNFLFEEESESSDEVQILNERPLSRSTQLKESKTALPGPAKAHASMFPPRTSQTPSRQPTPGPFQPARTCEAQDVVGQNSNREANTPTADLLSQTVYKLNLAQRQKIQLYGEQGQPQMTGNFGGVPPVNQALNGSGKIVVAPKTATASGTQFPTSQQHTQQQIQIRQNEGTALTADKTSQQGIHEKQGSEPQMPNVLGQQRATSLNGISSYNQATLRTSLMLKDGCKMEAEALKARENKEARINLGSNTPVIRNLLYHYDKEAPTSFKGLGQTTIEGGYSDTLVSKLEENYMKHRSLLLCKSGGLMTPYKFLSSICDEMKVNIHAEVFRFRGPNNETQYRTELYVGGFCGVAHAQNIGFSKQLAATHVLERMRVHCKAIQPTFYAVYPGSQYTKIKEKLEDLCQAFELGKAQYFYTDRRNGRGMSDDTYPRWECSVVVQNKEACVRSDHAAYGGFLAAKNMYTNFVRPPAVSVVQIKDYFACGAECPLLKEVHPSLLLNVPSKNKMKWKEDNGLTSIDPWLNDPTNESRYLFHTDANKVASFKLAEFQAALADAVELVLYWNRRGNWNGMSASNENRMDMDIDDGNDEFHDAEDDAIMIP